MIDKKNKWLCICISLIAIVFAFFPVYSAMVKGVFRWHISQPALWKDALELMIYIFVILISALFKKSQKGMITLIVGAVYLLSVGSLSQCIVSYVYIEIILCIGRSFLSVFTRCKKLNSVGINFLIGTVIWGTLAIVLSLLKHGTINELRMLTVILLIVSLTVSKRISSVEDLLIVRYAKWLNSIGWSEFAFHLLFFSAMLISCARVNTHVESDSAWYSLPVDKCLFGDNSFYDYLGYSSFVYYYPKFKELLMAPISGLGLAGYLTASNLWIMIICMIEVYNFLAERIKGNKPQVLGGVCLIFSTPCIMGISDTAKSDAISYLYMVMLIFYFARFIQEKDWTLLWISMISGIMSYTVKYTSFLFSTLIFFIIVIMLCYELIVKKIHWQGLDKVWIFIILCSCFILAGILYRTYLLTGYPTYSAGKTIWDKVGFSARPYFDMNVGTKSPYVWEWKRLFTTFWDVEGAEKIRAHWIGNYTILLAICSLVIYRQKKKENNLFLFVVSVALTVVSFYSLVRMSAPDGNYFSVPILVVSTYLLIRMATSSQWHRCKQWFSSILCIFVVLNVFFVLVTHPSWGWGTRASHENIVPYVSEEAKLIAHDENMKNLGIYEINEKLKKTDGKQFILSDGTTLMSMLNARVERAEYFFRDNVSGANIKNFEEFLKYIDYVNLGGFIVAKDGNGNQKFYTFVNEYLDNYGYIDKVETPVYTYYSIRKSSP